MRWGGGEEVPWELQGWGEEGGVCLDFPWSGPPPMPSLDALAGALESP